MNVIIKLVIVKIEHPSTYYILLENDSLPSFILTQPNFYNQLQELTSRLFLIKSDWIDFRLVNIEYDDNDLILNFTCLLPNIINTKIGDWISMGEINAFKDKKLIYQAIHKNLE